MKKCDLCGLYYDQKLEKCPYCNTKIGEFNKKIIKKDKVKSIVFKISVVFFVILTAINLITKSQKGIFIIVGAVIFYIAFAITGGLITDALNDERDETLTDKEKETYKKAQEDFRKGYKHDANLMDANGVYLDGIPEMYNEQRCKIQCHGDRVTIEMLESKRLFSIYYIKMLNVKVETTSKIISGYNDHVFTRALIGEALAGTAGAIYGGLSGIKDKRVNTDFLCIRYVNKSDIEDVLIIGNTSISAQMLSTFINNQMKDLKKMKKIINKKK